MIRSYFNSATYFCGEDSTAFFFLCCAYTGEAKHERRDFFVPVQNSIKTAIVFSIGVCSSKCAAELYFVEAN